ncbi:hypothetical protein [Longimicrobium terrae]|uniref:Uncharacterized protein n=1 Tax=Longimicrobium terrae TaxID=1639882 RepID=A0A841GYN7_9BACT|nr:hypothetical protein [Longimicrobium terrae]MBB4636622.1 hypothetical protein [Longimicrobium terrae]MBB6070854.1 hypothetical protein [Longimicrobium terrae]NNC28879.1 hypothetical protein [Longimicrobium terrae]
MEHVVRLRGQGRVEVPAYGVADAEHQVEKELAALWPEAGVDVLEVGRADADGRIVEEFRVGYRVRGSVSVTADTEEDARKTAVRRLRERFQGSRFARIAWEFV